MKIVADMKLFIGNKILERNLKQLKRELWVCNIEESKSIGIVYNANLVIAYEIIKNLTRDFTTKGKEVSALGYVDNKDLIDHYLYRKGFHFFTKTDLNWYYKPRGAEINQFLEKPFDILINLGLEKSLPIDFIVALSHAKFKAGKLFNNKNYVDLMIDTNLENKTMRNLQEEIREEFHGHHDKKGFETEIKPKIEVELQLNFLINQILHYLKMINNNKQQVLAR